MSDDNEKKYCYCSFCGKHQDYVKALVAGVSAMICDECIEWCSEIVADTRRKKMVAVEKGED